MSFHLDFGQDDTYETEWTMGVDEEVAIDIYVSNVPEPGLQSMGFVLVYDNFGFVSAVVDTFNWNFKTGHHSTPGKTEIYGSCWPPDSALYGNDIMLATVRLRSLGEGVTNLRLLDRDELHGSSYDCFILADGTVLDHEIPVDPVASISVTTAAPCPGDMDGDRDVDGTDLALFGGEYEVCTGDCAGDFSGDERVDAADLPFVTNNLGKTDCL